MSRVEHSNHVIFPRSLLVAIGAMPTIAASIFWYLGVAYNFLSPVESVIAPGFSILGFLFSLGFMFAPEKRLMALLIAYKMVGGTFILAGMIEGALSYDSHVKFILMWLPFYYVGTIFAATTPFQRQFSKVYFAVSTVSVLSALWLGPLKLVTEHSIFLVSVVLAQFLIVWKFYFIEGRMRRKIEIEKEMIEAQREAEEHERSAAQVKLELEISESANRAKSSLIANMSQKHIDCQKTGYGCRSIEPQCRRQCSQHP